MYVQTGSGAQAAIKAAESEYKKYADNAPFFYDFLDKNVRIALSNRNSVHALCLQLFAAIAIFISCLGLLGLIFLQHYTTYKRNWCEKSFGRQRIEYRSIIVGRFL